MSPSIQWVQIYFHWYEIRSSIYRQISEAKLAIHHIVMDVKICEKCRILRFWLQKASDIQYESTKPASKRTNISVFKRNIKRDSSHLLPKKFHWRLKTPFRRFQHHSAVINWFEIRHFHKFKFHRIWTCWTNSLSKTVSGYPDYQGIIHIFVFGVKSIDCIWIVVTWP